MNCAMANKTQLVEFLSLLGYQPSKIRNSDYWYLSPFRDERDPSFKVNTIKNLWYDDGMGKGGKTVDFVMQHFNCNVTGALYKLSLFQQQNYLKEASIRLQCSPRK